MKKMIGSLVLTLLALPALAQDKSPDKSPGTSPAPAIDWSKVGPASRKPKDEKAVKQEIDAFLKTQEQSMKEGDLNASLAGIAFPVLMVTDDAQGKVTAREFSREEYVTMMKPFFENRPKDMVVTHKYAVTVLSDALAGVACDYTMTMGKQKVSGRSDGLLIKQDGKWMWKVMVEAGWGSLESQKAAKPPAGKAAPPPAQ